VEFEVVPEDVVVPLIPPVVRVEFWLPAALFADVPEDVPVCAPLAVTGAGWFVAKPVASLAVAAVWAKAIWAWRARTMEMSPADARSFFMVLVGLEQVDVFADCVQEFAAFFDV
jgi:hypothetical protein